MSTRAVKQLLSHRFCFDEWKGPAVALSERQRERVGEFRRLLQTGDFRFVSEPCPCGDPAQGVVISEIDRYGLRLDFVLCLHCGTVRIDPYLDDDSLDQFYRHLYQEMYARATALEPYFTKQQPYGRKVLAVYRGLLSPTATVLEVGCGAGGGLLAFQQAGFRTAGCDYSRELIEFGRQRGVTGLFVGSVEEGNAVLPGLGAELIYLHHVFEHVSHPRELLSQLKRRLAPAGRILVIVPDLWHIHRFDNPGGDALRFFHVAHKYNYTLTGLGLLAEQVGLRVRRLDPGDEVRTAWAEAPELWVELTPAEPVSSARVAAPRRAGRAALWYLRLTEAGYRAGLCPAQLARLARRVSAKLRSVRKRFWYGNGQHC